MLKILNRITTGDGNKGDIKLLEELAEVVHEASLCALGGTAANPVLSTIKYFREEYETHINEKRCSAGVCNALIKYHIDPEKCKGCGLCKKNCPADAVIQVEKKLFEIDTEKCIKCGACIIACPKKFDAVEKIPEDTSVSV